MWWSVPNNFGILGLNTQFTCTSNWDYPTIGGLRGVSSGNWFNVTLAPNSLVSNSTKVASRQPSFYIEIWVEFPSPQDVRCLTTPISLFPPIFQPLIPTSPMYIFSLVGLSRWGDLPHFNGSFRIILLTKGDSPPTADMTS